MHEQLLGIARTAMAQRLAQTSAEILGIVQEIAALPFLSPRPSDEQVVAVAKQIEREYEVILGPAHTIQASGHKPWLRARAHEIDFRYWNRYRQFLIGDGMSEHVVNAVNAVTDTIVDLAGDPSTPGKWSRRGLVVGHVQSGKTANYLGLINKAADAGYRLVILIAGVHNNLRSQTQERVDFGFVGRDSDQILSRQVNVDRVGVGNINPAFTATAYTSRAYDFARNKAESLGNPLQNSSEPVILVIKKNPSILTNLIDWIRGTSASQGGLTLPMLVIDDEADNASVDTSKDQKAPRTINRLIRALLSLSSRNAYIGYTATPFANIFIDPDSENGEQGKDLFPRDFIVGLDAPSNYVGAREFFLSEDSERLTVELDATEDWLPVKHRIDWKIEGLHETLIEAIDCFVLSKAIRILRGSGARHHSMLVNVSRFTRVQGDVAKEISRHVIGLQSAIQNRHAMPADSALRDPIIRSLNQTWDKHYSSGDENWSQIQQELHRASASIQVVEINASKSSGKLDYRAHADTGLNVIAVGGNSLSRGFTLEGLTVSYFLRNTQMYDTLLQMGRWFGYRDGFKDLCRLFIKSEASDWYGFIADATEELRDEIRRMELVGLTPMDFGLAVRSHPGTLLVTAREKMRNTEEIVREVGLSGSMVESSALIASELARVRNIEAVSQIAKRLLEQQQPVPVDPLEHLSSQLFRDVDTADILDFVASFSVHPGQLEMQTAPLIAYIRDRQLTQWDVVLVSNSRAKAPDDVEDLHGLSIGLQERIVEQRKISRFENALLVSGTKRRVASRGVERIGLSDEEVQRAKAAHGESKKSIPDRLYRAERTRPLLMLHLLRTKTKEHAKGEKVLGEMYAAYGLSFPKLESGKEEKLVRYTANLIAYRELYGSIDDEQDDEPDSPDA
ncbi:Z1 domain-containing protein [Xanthomonas campestris]|uniref:Z1 domain-containing protein n=1 Tax=Xanthomonas campestris TaxID=339 RepID=UPI002379265F|nr:Z1 domain-containing protein [Xanthomonas campestris]MEA9809381.1 Z1 domain-containing protein [Xanthomonas campestris pv. raphani]WDL16896.1 Z1 domain-containing protein [Xanthomonas campestris pv. campestris]WDL20978.1 Z1 domain-containing protein [Xanthomonas campestris pv. campestris]WDL26941.1 Z1 domain-containing protein [Xanthomonas campestris pv. campestris]WDL29150.1 Z1 domain-containing protein [Xanthomonas campestris pv. campestris]